MKNDTCRSISVAISSITLPHIAPCESPITTMLGFASDLLPPMIPDSAYALANLGGPFGDHVKMLVRTLNVQLAGTGLGVMS